MKLTLNLASRRYLNERALKWAYLLLLLLFVFLLLMQAREYLQSRQQGLVYQKNIAKLEEQLQGKIPKRFTAAQIATQQKDYARAESMLQDDAFRWTALFDRLEGLLPSNVSIQSFSPNYKSNSLVISGVAKNLIDLQDLLDNLHADSFSQVFLQNQNRVEVLDYQDNKRPALAFSILLEGVF